MSPRCICPTPCSLQGISTSHRPMAQHTPIWILLSADLDISLNLRWKESSCKMPGVTSRFPPAAMVVLAGDRVDAWLQLLPNLGVSSSWETHHSAGPGTTRLLLLQYAMGQSDSPLLPFSTDPAWKESEKGKHQEDVATLSCQQMLFQCPLLENVFGPHSCFV